MTQVTLAKKDGLDAVSTRVGTIEGKAVPTYYVDSVAGVDTNSGLTQALPFKTLAKVKTVIGTPGFYGASIRLKAGSSFREGLDYELFPSIKIEGYGDFAVSGIPKVRGDDVIAGPWQTSTDRADANTNVYSIAWTHTVVVGPQTLFPVFENGVMSNKATSLANCQATPGTFWHDTLVGFSTTIYYHPLGDTNPNSDGKVYETYRRHAVIAVGDNSTVKWVHAHAAGATLGSIYHGYNGLIENVLATGNHLHDINGGTGRRYRCVAFHPVVPTTGGAILIETFAPDLKHGTMTHDRCIAIGPAAVGTTDINGFGGHTASGGDDASVVELIDCAGYNVTFDCSHTRLFRIVRANMQNGAILLGARLDGFSTVAEIIDLQMLKSASATRGYILTDAAGGTANPAQVRVEGARIYCTDASLSAVFSNPANLSVTNSILVSTEAPILTMLSTVQRQRAVMSHNILVGAITKLFYNVRNFLTNSGTLDSDYNIIRTFGTNNTNSILYSGKDGGGTFTTKYTLADVRATFTQELHSVDTDPGIANAAGLDWRIASNGGISGAGLARPNIKYTPIPTTEQQCKDWLIYGTF